MTEFDPTKRGDVSKPIELNVTEQFFSMRLSQFRDYLDELWKQNKDTKVVIELPARMMITKPGEAFLHQLSRDPRVLVVKPKQ